MEVYVVDSHALLWFITEDKRLSSVAERRANSRSG